MVRSQLLSAQDQCLSRDLRTRRPSREAGSCMRRRAAIPQKTKGMGEWLERLLESILANCFVTY